MTAFINRFIPDNQNMVICAKQTAEQYAAEDYLLKNAVKLTAEQCADYCRYFFASFTAQGLASEREAIEPFLLSQRVKMPHSVVGWLPEKMRLEDKNWWARQLKKRDMREAEQGRIASNKVHKYCSDALLNIMKQQQARLAEWLQRSTITNDDGFELSLAEVAKGSITNPRLRRNELMVRIKGMEQYAAILGHSCRFITVTAPSTYHKSKGEKYNGYTPKQVQEYLTTTWARVRAKLARQNINIYGLRVTEPHKDSCPHWHLLAWFESAKQAQIAVKTIRHYFLAQDGQEQGALFNRVKTITINPLKGGASGYVAKYVCKNVDGAHVDTMTDRDGQAVTNGEDGAARVRAWASCWAARQFQFIGGAPVTLWRELRRIREAAKVPNDLFLLWHTADSADYCGFMIAYQVAKEQGDKPMLKKHKFLDDLQTLADKFGGVENVPDGEILKLKTLNKYQEPKANTVGVVMGNSEIKTRFNTWTLKTEFKKDGFVKPQDALEAYAASRGRGADFGELVKLAGDLGVFRHAVGRGVLDLWQ